MKSDAYDPDGDPNAKEVPPTTMFEALSEVRRQYTLQYLAQKPAAVPLGDVAEYIAIREGEPTRDRYERIITGLYHQHIPHLCDARIVTYDDTHKTVSLQLERADLTRYLQLLRQNR